MGTLTKTLPVHGIKRVPLAVVDDSNKKGVKKGIQKGVKNKGSKREGERDNEG